VTPRECVLLKYGELMLKGRNRPWFERHLVRNLKAALQHHPGLVRIGRRHGLLVLYPEAEAVELAQRMRDLLGVSVVQPAVRLRSVPPQVVAGVLELLDRGDEVDHRAPRTFAVRVRRRNKAFPMTSMQLEAHVGRHICERFGWRVDLEQPDLTVWLEIDSGEAFASVERLCGQGGLPVGTSGRALVLLSGGFDSPVAAYRAMRRGLRCEFVHFTGAPYTGPASAYKAYALARELSRYQGSSRLHVIPIGALQKDLATAGAGALQSVAHRRLMISIAAELAPRARAECLVTGDSLGQVSSQTLSNLTTIEQASLLPLLRPLLAWDKEEIITEARRIGTAAVSRVPDEDCCTLLNPPTAATVSDPQRLTVLEQRAHLDDGVDAALAHTQVLQVPGTPPGRRRLVEVGGSLGAGAGARTSQPGGG
jgi:tRNA uracil 4-sulfurtransferase